MAIADQLERIIKVLDEINGTSSKGYGMNMEEKVYFISTQIQKMKDNGFGELPIHICGSGDFDSETGIPTVENPEENVFYLVPTGEDSNDMFEEWVYVNDEWEHFGAGGSIDIPAPNWDAAKGESGFIQNKPPIYRPKDNDSNVYFDSCTSNGRFNSFAHGQNTTASGAGSHSEGCNTVSSGSYAHAEGYHTIANGTQSHVFGRYNIEDPNDNNIQFDGSAICKSRYVEIVGNGINVYPGHLDDRSNARTLDWSGNEWIAGNMTAAGGSITIGDTTLTEEQLKTIFQRLSMN